MDRVAELSAEELLRSVLCVHEKPRGITVLGACNALGAVCLLSWPRQQVTEKEEAGTMSEAIRPTYGSTAKWRGGV